MYILYINYLGTNIHVHVCSIITEVMSPIYYIVDTVHVHDIGYYVLLLLEGTVVIGPQYSVGSSCLCYSAL